MDTILVIAPSVQAYHRFLNLINGNYKQYKYIHDAKQLHGHRGNTVIIFEGISQKLASQSIFGHHLYTRDFRIFNIHEDDYKRREWENEHNRTK